MWHKVGRLGKGFRTYGRSVSTKHLTCLLSSFFCSAVFHNRILHMAVGLNLGQKHKRQAEVPDASPAQTCAQCKVNPHIHKNMVIFLSALPLHPVTSKSLQSKCLENSLQQAFEGNGWLLSEQFGWERLELPTQLTISVSYLLLLMK